MTHEEFNNLLETVAYHVSEVMTTPAPHKGSMGIFHGDKTVVVNIEITPSEQLEPFPGNPTKYPIDVWDQTKVDGKHTGNRCGGRNALMAAYADVILAAAKEVE
jgi:hypothetical protein